MMRQPKTDCALVICGQCKHSKKVDEVIKAGFVSGIREIQENADKFRCNKCGQKDMYLYFAATPINDSDMFFATKASEEYVYHRRNCETMRWVVKDYNQLKFKNREHAEACQFRPCKVCKP